MDKKNLGDYLILKEIGKGTFGNVYLAKHRFIKKKYAIKILPKSLSSNEEFVKRFEKKVSVLATLDHSSIVKLHNISYADKHYFLVMDAIISEDDEIENLENYLERESQILSEKKLEIILRQLASCIDYVHDINMEEECIIHGGLKLSNIFVKEDEKGPKAFISDFAFSKILGERSVLLKNYENFIRNLSSDESSLIFKNFSFLSPEQKKGKEATIQSDVFSFGVLAYYMIARDFPVGYFDLPLKIAEEYKLNWDLFICKCLAKDPQKRPLRLTEALNTFLSTEVSNKSSMDVLSWEEVEKKVENAMQMSFEFSTSKEEKKEEEESLLKDDSNTLKPIIKPQKVDRPKYDQDPAAIFQKELTVSYYKPKKEQLKEIKPLLTKMVIIPGGVYNRGNDNGPRDERPAHSVTISSFAIDIHPITNEQFARFLEVMGGEKDVNNNDIIKLSDSRIKRRAGSLIIEPGYLKHPVVGITWYGAAAYVKWIGKRLPTEAEWEIASNGNVDGSIYPSGEKIDHTLANFFGSDTTSVMSYPANGYGLYDMSGNVYEWCQDWYAYNYYDLSLQEPENPKGPPQGVYRVLRGGCWKSLKEDLRISHRHRNNPGSFNSTCGFRCAAEVS